MLDASDAPFAGRHVMVVCAHPDDEVIGFGGQMSSVRRLSLVHLTEGAPSARTARAHGFATPGAYARARRRELEAAVALACVPVDWTRFDLPDMRVSLHLRAAESRLAAAIGRLKPDIVVTHPYEGGHPDHDAAAFITQAAFGGGPACGPGRGGPRVEMTSYHAGPAGLRTGAFLDLPDIVEPQTRLALSSAQQTLKRAMLDCFWSQRAALAPFGVAEERFRPAPLYDFGRAPHPGRLHYENRRRAMRGAMWRGLAAVHDTPKSSFGRLRAATVRATLNAWLIG